MDTKKLRQKILDLAIRGKLVPQDPNDEPASVLLERIRAEKERLIAEGKIKRPKKSKSSSSESHYQNLTPPFPIPDSWEWVRLGEICSIKGGKRIPRGKTFSAHKTSHVYLRVSDMKNNTIVMSDLKYIDEDVFEEIKNYTIHSSDLYLTIAGTIGSVGSIPHEVSGMNLTENAAKLTNIGCVKEYLLYALSSSFVQEHFSSRFHQVAQPKLSIETASSAYIPLPPFYEQQRIVSEIENFLEQIAYIENEKENLQFTIQQAKSKIMDLAMQGKIVPQDLLDEAAADMLRRINPKAKIITDNPHSWNIPESWCWCQLGDIFYHNTGKALNASNGDGIEYEYITTSNVYWERFELSSLKIMLFKDSEIDKCSVKKGDLLVCEGGDIGRAAIWDLDRSVMIQNHLHRLRPYSVDICTRLYCKILRAYKHKQLIGGKGIALQGFSSNALHKLIVPLIPAEEQRKMLDRIESLFAILGRIEISLQS